MFSVNIAGLITVTLGTHNNIKTNTNNPNVYRVKEKAVRECSLQFKASHLTTSSVKPEATRRPCNETGRLTISDFGPKKKAKSIVKSFLRRMSCPKSQDMQI